MSRIAIPVEDEHVRDLLGRLGVLDAARHVKGADEARTTAVLALRRAERAQALGLDDGQVHLRTAEFGITAARQQIILAREAFRARAGSSEWNDIANRLDEVSRSPEGQRILADGEVLLRHKLLEIDMTKEDAVEISAMYGQVIERLTEGGVRAVSEAIDGYLGELIDVSQVDFGRRPHSPLEWWEWLIIIVVVCVSVYFLLECLFWAGCSWILHFFWP